MTIKIIMIVLSLFILSSGIKLNAISSESDSNNETPKASTDSENDAELLNELLDEFRLDKQSTFDLKKSAHYSEKGADTCLQCHDEDSTFPVLDIFKTAHGNPASQRGPFSQGELQCESCHGPAGEHSKKRLRRGESREPMIAFKSREAVPVVEKSKICLNCHQKNQLGHWQGSEHQLNETTCVDCHKIHTLQDPMSDKQRQAKQCTTCHLTQKLALNRASTHPLREGQMTCSDCHKPHDANNENLLIGDTLNETCFECHAEKRGPYLWEHEPVSDNCANCHNVHGSNQPAMLTHRAPYLCQSCHSSQGHPSFAFDSQGLANNSPSVFLLGRSCVNCHSQVHGSNHPSGAKLQR